MSTAFQEIEARALRLDESERAELAERLVQSLSGKSQWVELAKKRRDDVRSGAVKLVSGEEALAAVRRLVGR